MQSTYIYYISYDAKLTNRITRRRLTIDPPVLFFITDQLRFLKPLHAGQRLAVVGQLIIGR